MTSIPGVPSRDVGGRCSNGIGLITARRHATNASLPCKRMRSIVTVVIWVEGALSGITPITHNMFTQFI